MFSINLMIIMTCLEGVNCNLNSTLAEEYCKDCTAVGNIFLKTIWFPIAPPEYLCINSSQKVSKRNLITDVVCNQDDCKNISFKKPSKLWDPNLIHCECGRNVNPQTTFTHPVIDIVVLVIVIIFLIASGIKNCCRIIKNNN